MATSKIEKSVKTSVSINEVNFTASTSLAYTGVSIPIKANTPFMLFVQAVYTSGEPKEVYLSQSSTESAAFRRVAGGEVGTTSLCGTCTSATTIYVWAKYGNATTNSIRYRLVYFE